MFRPQRRISELICYVFFRYPNVMLMDATYKTCKLSLPLFFLVVKTNVGYSVIAEFSIQHKDSQSIAEALGLLRAQWDANQITVGNFMIDCQQSEENAIRGIFPESVIFLCSFHRLQAWLRWLVNGKNGVSQYKDQCMSILHSLGESKTRMSTQGTCYIYKSPTFGHVFQT